MAYEKRLIIVRHGNTFKKGDRVTRVGAGTDLPLVEEEKGRNAGKYLLEHNLIPTKLYAAPLKRTMQTAELIRDEIGLPLNVIPYPEFTEIDYGPDENKSEEEVIARIGQAALDNWNTLAVPPPGWKADTEKIISAWKAFAQNIASGETALVVTSNGIIRFAPHILAMGYDEFRGKHDIKVKTGSIGVFTFDSDSWNCQAWNLT